MFRPASLLLPLSPSPLAARIFSTIQRLWKYSILQQVLHIPFGRALRLPGPEKPARSALIRVELCLNIMSYVRLIFGGESGHGARGLPRATAGMGKTLQRAIIAGACAKSVEPFRAARDHQSPVEEYD